MIFNPNLAAILTNSGRLGRNNLCSSPRAIQEQKRVIKHSIIFSHAVNYRNICRHRVLQKITMTRISKQHCQVTTLLEEPKYIDWKWERNITWEINSPCREELQNDHQDKGEQTPFLIEDDNKNICLIQEPRPPQIFTKSKKSCPSDELSVLLVNKRGWPIPRRIITLFSPSGTLRQEESYQVPATCDCQQVHVGKN